MIRDWGVVAFGTQSPVVLTHVDGLESQSWPGADLTQTLAASTVSPPDFSGVDGDSLLARAKQAGGEGSGFSFCYFLALGEL